MVSLLNNEISVWQRLQEIRKPIVLYGMGDGAQKILNVCLMQNIRISGIFASDDFVRGQNFAGFEVQRLEKIERQYDDFVVLVGFATRLPKVLADIGAIGRRYELYIPDVPIFDDDELFDENFLRKYFMQFRQAYRSLADERSRQIYIDTLSFKLSGRPQYLRRTQEHIGAGYQLLKLGAQEHYLDLGAYRGDTIEEFLTYTEGSYASITALEPDPRTYRKLCEKVQRLGLVNVECLNVGSYREEGQFTFASRYGRGSTFSMFTGLHSGVSVQVTSVDRLYADRPLSYIKMDVEGAEAATLEGAAAVLARQRPKLRVSLYHRNTDLFALPLLIKRLNPAYSLYLRAVPYVPAWDLNLYAV